MALDSAADPDRRSRRLGGGSSGRRRLPTRLLHDAADDGRSAASGTSSKRSTSTSPRSVIFRLGITESARKASDWNGDSTFEPSACTAATVASLASITSASGRSETSPATGSGSSAVTASPSTTTRPPPSSNQPLDRERHLVVAHADDDDVVGVVREGGGEARRDRGRTPARSRGRSCRCRDAARSRRSSRGRAPGRPSRRSSSSTSDSVTIWPGTRPITRAGPPSHSTAKSSAETGRTRTLCVTHSGTGVGWDLVDRAAALEHDLGNEALEVGQEQQIGLVAGRDRAERLEPVPERRMVRRHHERVLGRNPVRHRVADDRVDVAVLGDVLRLAVVGAERHPRSGRTRRRAAPARAGSSPRTPRGSAATSRRGAARGPPRR